MGASGFEGPLQGVGFRVKAYLEGCVTYNNLLITVIVTQFRTEPYLRSRGFIAGLYGQLQVGYT